jgi:hypothetical protein
VPSHSVPLKAARFGHHLFNGSLLYSGLLRNLVSPCDFFLIQAAVRRSLGYIFKFAAPDLFTPFFTFQKI